MHKSKRGCKAEVIPNQNQKVYLLIQRSHKILHLKVEALAEANVKLLSVKDYGLFAFKSVCFNFDLV